MLLRLFVASVSVVALGGCVANSYCLDEQSYQKAGSVQPLAGTDTISLPQSATVLRIPPPSEDPVPFGQLYTDEEGDERGRCLDMPPMMATLEDGEPDPPPAEKPKKKPTKAPSPKKGQRPKGQKPETEPEGS